jgi:hypothetical protein
MLNPHIQVYLPVVLAASVALNAAVVPLAEACVAAVTLIVAPVVGRGFSAVIGMQLV